MLDWDTLCQPKFDAARRPGWTRLTRSRCEAGQRRRGSVRGRVESTAEHWHDDARTIGRRIVRGIRVLLLQVLTSPHLVVARPVIEVERRPRSAVLENACDRLPIRMREVVAVGREDVVPAVERLNQLRADVVLAPVVGHLEDVHLQLVRRVRVIAQQLADRLDDDRRVRVGGQQRARAGEFRQQRDARAVGRAVVAAEGVSASSSTFVDVDGVPLRNRL